MCRAARAVAAPRSLTKSLPLSPRSAFLALSVSDSPQDVGAVIRAGARGYVTKTITANDLVSSIRQVHEGYAVFSPKLAGFVLSAFQGAPMGGAPVHDDELDRLSAREQEVMRLIARGYTYKEVASELFISIKTVETHMSSVLRKLQLSNRTELTRWAAESADRLRMGFALPQGSMIELLQCFGSVRKHQGSANAADDPLPQTPPR